MTKGKEDNRLEAKFVNGKEGQDNEEEKKEDPVQPISYFKLYRYSTMTDRIAIAVAIIASMIGGIGTPVMMIFFGDVTEDIIGNAMIIFEETSTLEEVAIAEEAVIDAVTLFLIYCSALAAATFLVVFIGVVLFSMTCVRQISKIRSIYMKQVLNQDITWYDMNKTGDFSSRVVEDLLKVEEGIGDKVVSFAFSMGTAISGLVIAFIWGWELALICLISFPVSAIALGIVAWVTSKFSQKETDSYGAAGAIAEEVLTAIKTVFAFGGQQKEINRYKNHLVNACTNNIKRSYLTALSNGLMMFFMFASYSLAFWYGIGLIIEQQDWEEEDRVYTAATMITVFFCVLMSSFSFGMSAPFIQTFGQAKGAAAKIFFVIDNDPIINLSKNNGKKLDKVRGNIKFSNVHFNYPAREDVKVLQGVNLEIQPGETVALVGSSGCGKSTCVQLLQRFYDPFDGEVLLDDVSLRDFDLTWYRGNIGVVGQEPVLFGTTVAENIKFGNRSATQEEIERAARKANAHSFIMDLPNGYRTMVGQRGSQLSGGQKQRIAIARALVREPAILLLDEATSALDTKSEAQVQRAIDKISTECTTIIIAHRLSTIKNADKIFVFSEGQVVEVGTHSELMQRKQAYYDLVINQVSISTHTGEASTYTDEDDDVKDALAEIKYDEEEAIEAQIKSSSPIRRLLIMNKPEWWLLVLGGIAAAIAGAAMPVYAVVFGNMLTYLLHPDPEVIRSQGNLYSLYFLLIGIVTGISTFFQWSLIGIAGEKLTRRVRGTMFETILRQEIAWFDRKDNGVGAICAKLSSDAANIQGASGYPIMVAINSISTICVAAGLSLYYEWRLALVALLILPVILIGSFFEMKYAQMDTFGSKNCVERSAKIAVEAVSNIRTVASLGCEEVFHTMYTSELLPHYKKGKTSGFIRGAILGLSRSLIYFAYGIVFFYGGHLIVNDGLSANRVFQVSEALIGAAMAVGSVMAFAPNFQKGIIAARKMFILVERVPLIMDGPNSTNIAWKDGHVSYEKIKFTYPTRPNTTILENFNLKVFPGKTIALVGPSGCGKSTLVQLIQRFYDPVSGSVSIDSIQLQDYKISALRSHLGIVSQEPNLFDRTISENIAYGDNNRLVSEEEVMEAAKKANIHNFIASLPLGYGTPLGDKGTQLSGGQKQRVAIARALVRNPQILLLDEATSALDTESEKVVQEALDNAKVGRTCITIAHRLTTIQDADVICVIDKGVIIEQGTHDELLTLRGLYHKLYELQQR